MDIFTELPALRRARLNIAADEGCGENANEAAGPEIGPPGAGKGLEEAAQQKWPCFLVSLFFSTSSSSSPPDVVIICKWRLANGGAGNSNGNGNIETLVHATYSTCAACKDSSFFNNNKIKLLSVKNC